LNTVYQYTSIEACIKKLGISPIDKEEEYNSVSSLVYYWQLSNPVDDITNIIPLFNGLYYINYPFAEFKVFEQGKIIDYILVGRVAFAITNILGEDFELKDSLGNDVTDDFDSQYFAESKTLLLVSKLSQSISNIYFRFKKL
jgi:hypothetical protein